MCTSLAGMVPLVWHLVRSQLPVANQNKDILYHIWSLRRRRLPPCLLSFPHLFFALGKHFLCFLFLACSHTCGFPAADNSAHDLGLGTTKKMFVQSCMHPSILFDDGWQQQQSGPEWMRPLCVLTQPDQSGPLLYNRLIS